jgi:hypothetical protein
MCRVKRIEREKYRLKNKILRRNAERSKGNEK